MVALSTDKASAPANLYGASKLVSDKLFIAGNFYSGDQGTQFSVVRYGNVMGSRGSVIPFFLNQAAQGKLTITDKRMTRFMISLDQGIDLIWKAFDDMNGGEVYVKKIPSIRITDLADAIAPNAVKEYIGIRPGEKVHEQMIGNEDAQYTYEYEDYFKILPAILNCDSNSAYIKDGVKVEPNFTYSSETNHQWMTKEALLGWMERNKDWVGKF